VSRRLLRVSFNTFPAIETGNEICVPDATKTHSSDGSSLLPQLLQVFRSDEELAEQLQRGNADALTLLFTRHSHLIFGICRPILRNDSEAEDATQQVFLDVFRSIHQFDSEKRAFKTWLMMFAYHRTLNHRRALIAARFFDTDPLDDLRPELYRPGRTYEGPEGRVLVQQILSGLQSRQRRTIELTYYEGLTADEISVRTGETVRVVRHNLYRGMKQLRNTLCGPTVTQEADR